MQMKMWVFFARFLFNGPITSNKHFYCNQSKTIFCQSCSYFVIKTAQFYVSSIQNWYSEIIGTF